MEKLSSQLMYHRKSVIFNKTSTPTGLFWKSDKYEESNNTLIEPFRNSILLLLLNWSWSINKQVIWPIIQRTRFYIKIKKVLQNYRIFENIVIFKLQ